MVGTSAEILLPVSIEELNRPEGYLGYMLGGSQGYFYRLLRNHPDRYGNMRDCQQEAYSIKNLIAQPNLFQGVHSCYCSMNSFWRERNLPSYKGRDRAHLKRLRSCYVDLDFYDLGLTQEYVLKKVHLLIKAGIIPKPTLIISSGKGLYLVYKLRDEDARAVNRWSDIQHYLVETLKDLGADSHCTDPSRVLRVPGTINAKNGATVTVLEFEDIVYTVYELHKKYGSQFAKKKIVKPAKKDENRIVHPYNHATEAQRNYVAGLAKRLKLSEEDFPNFESFQETDAWIKAHKDLKRPVKAPSYKTDIGYDLMEYKSIRDGLDGNCEDISKLLLMRKGEEGCRREIGLFLIRRFRREMGYTKEQALREILELNAQLDCPLETEEVINATASADTHFYAYSRAKIISVLKVKEEELKELSHLGVRRVATKEYRRAANRRAYESRLAAEGKVAKKDAIKERRAEILSLQEQGMSAEEIREKLNISKATYHRDLVAIAAENALEAAQEVVKEKVEQVIEIAEKATDAVAEAVQTVKKVGLRAVIRAALLRFKSAVMAGVSHFFSSPFKKMNCKAVLQASNLHERDNTGLSKLGIIRSGDRGDGEDPDDASPLSCP